MEKLNVKTKQKTNKGITLIALVITIIVLLILAAVSIATLTGENGILTKTNQAKEQTEKATAEEKRQLTIAEAAMNFENTKYTDKSGTGTEIIIPAGFAVSQVEGENTIDDGLVIIDSKGNEFVWIEVPQNTNIYQLTGLGKNKLLEEDYTNIEKDLQNYASGFRDSDFYDMWSSSFKIGIDEYNNLKNKMLSYIYKNGGFWFGRYEAGTSEDIEEYTTDMNITLFSKQNQYTLGNLTYPDAFELSLNMYNGSCTSTLPFGLQWDLMLRFIEEKQVAKKGEDYRDTIHKLLTEDSNSIGNYGVSEFYLDRGKYKKWENYVLDEDWKEFDFSIDNYVENKLKKSQDTNGYGILYTTGASDNNSLENIFDFAGNVWEYTCEQWGPHRGGSCTGSR